MRLELAGFLKPAEWVSSNTLTKKIKISRQALHKQISLLRKVGYEIQAKPRLGYRLIAKPDLLLPEEIHAGLKTKTIGQASLLSPSRSSGFPDTSSPSGRDGLGRNQHAATGGGQKIFHFQRIDSTQKAAKELAEKGEPEGTLVIAEEQTAGRGRLGRRWESPKGGIWFSLILRPPLPPQDVPSLSLVFSLAVAKAIEEHCSVPCWLKWPNDILIQDSRFKIQDKKWKKVCGILVELSAETERVNWAVVGIGLNVNNVIPAFLKNQATTLKEAIKAPQQRVPLLQSMLSEIEKSYEQFLSEGFAEMRKDYLKKSIFLGKKITVLDSGKKITGKFIDIAEDGALVLENEAKKQIPFVTGEVHPHTPNPIY